MTPRRQYAEEGAGKNCRGRNVVAGRRRKKTDRMNGMNRIFAAEARKDKKAGLVSLPQFDGHGVNRGFRVIPVKSGTHKYFLRNPKGIDRNRIDRIWNRKKNFEASHPANPVLSKVFVRDSVKSERIGANRSKSGINENFFSRRQSRIGAAIHTFARTRGSGGLRSISTRPRPGFQGLPDPASAGKLRWSPGRRILAWAIF
jgi:hypothetical protein